VVCGCGRPGGPPLETKGSRWPICASGAWPSETASSCRARTPGRPRCAARRRGQGAFRRQEPVAGARRLRPGAGRARREPSDRDHDRAAGHASRARPAGAAPGGPALLGAALGSAAATVVLRRTMKQAPMLRELTVSALSVLPALLAVHASELSRFHGAEHKSVAAYETGGEPAARPKSTTAAAPTCSVRCCSRIWAQARAARHPQRQRSAVDAGHGAGLSRSAFEIFSWMAHHRGHPLAELLRAPGVTMQRLFTTR